MTANLTIEKVDASSLIGKAIGYKSEDMVYILARGPKHSAMFMPIMRGDPKYKCKNDKMAIKAAMQRERVFAFDSVDDLFRHFLT